ncbi:tetraspanin-7-like [Halichondria panicea]|uniref:tetraspanin-7-like n=1 Tax=Halichondria panicea TaxID=6063 RepID=UPI00312BC0B0
MNFLECMRRFSQALLIITNSIVGLLGLAVLILGIWAQVSGRDYFDFLSLGADYSPVGILLIVVGVFIVVIGIIGIIGAIFAGTLFGRITLGLYAVILGLLILCEISIGIAAGVKRNDLNSYFRDSAQQTFNESGSDPSKADTWNTLQTLFDCCGVNSYKDYRYLNGNNSVPASCCNPNATDFCDSIRLDVTNNTGYYISSAGCVDVLVSGVDTYLGAIAGGGIVFGLFQIIGVVMACFVAIYKDRENKYEVV